MGPEKGASIVTNKLSNGGRLRRRCIPPNLNGGRRLLQRLVRPGGSPYRASRSGYTQVTATLACQVFVDFAVSWYGRRLVVGQIDVKAVLAEIPSR